MGKAVTGSEVVAIIDGDDIGGMLEHLMLNDDMKGVLSLSARITVELATLVEGLSRIEGVRVLSMAGDSALFEFDDMVCDGFAQRLMELRVELSVPFSCGIGVGLRNAFIALRLAKTSGKNKTVALYRE